MPKVVTLVLSAFCTLAAVASLIARQWVLAGLALAGAAALDLVLVKTLAAERATKGKP